MSFFLGSISYSTNTILDAIRCHDSDGHTITDEGGCRQIGTKSKTDPILNFSFAMYSTFFFFLLVDLGISSVTVVLYQFIMKKYIYRLELSITYYLTKPTQIKKTLDDFRGLEKLR